MNRNHVVLITVLIVALVAVAFMAAFWRPGPPFANPEAPASLRDESLTYLKDVVGFDLTDYEVTDSHFVPQLDVASSNGLPLYLMTYDLRSSDDEAYVDIFYTGENNTYTHEPYFQVRSDTIFSPAYPSDKVLNWTKAFLERYRAFQNNASYVSEMCVVLDAIDQIQPLNVTSGGTALQIAIKQFNEQEIYTTLKFSPTNSTAHDYDNAVTFEFHNGALLHFSDWYGVTR